MPRVLFWRGTDLTSRAIKIFTWSSYSHVDIKFDDGQVVGALPGEGVIVRRANADDRDEFEVDGAPWGQIEQLMYSQVGRPYDWGGIVSFLPRRKFEASGRWFCSELVAWAFAEAGMPLLREDESWRLTPRDLSLSPHLRHVPWK